MAKFDLIWNKSVSAQGVLPYTEDGTSFLLHTAEGEALTLIVLLFFSEKSASVQQTVPYIGCPWLYAATSTSARLNGTQFSSRVYVLYDGGECLL